MPLSKVIGGGWGGPTLSGGPICMGFKGNILYFEILVGYRPPSKLPLDPRMQ